MASEMLSMIDDATDPSGAELERIEMQMTAYLKHLIVTNTLPWLNLV